MDLTPLRLSMRAQRAQLGEQVQQLAANSAFHLALANQLFDDVQRVAFYYPHMGELSTFPLISHAQERGIDCYLPSMQEQPDQPLTFHRVDNDTQLSTHSWGIVQPDEKSEALDPAQLDMVFMPLVAFDRQGHRLGMGKGYYDRSFAFLNHEDRPKKPLLIGYAYDFQQVEQLTPNPWDVALDGLLTDTRYLRFSDKNNS